MNPFLNIVFSVFTIYAEANKLPINITCITSDVPGRYAPLVHREGRAVDISLKGWSLFHQQSVVHLLNRRFGSKWGTRAVDSAGPTKVILVHGEVKHFHAQVRRGLTIIDFLEVME